MLGLHGPSALLALALALGSDPAAPPAHVTIANGTMRVTERWGDARLIAGGGVGGASLSADGARLAAISPLGIFVWDVATGAELRIPRAWTKPSRMDVPFVDGKTIVTTREQEIETFDGVTGARRATIALSGLKYPYFAVSPTGLVAAAWEMSLDERPVVELWDLAAGKRLRQIEGTKLDRASFVAGGRRLLGVHDDRSGYGAGRGTTSLWDVSTGTLVFQDVASGVCTKDACWPTKLLVAPDGRHVLRALGGGTQSGVPRAHGRGKHAASNATSPFLESVDLDGSDRHRLADGNPTFALSGDGRTVAFRIGFEQIEVWDVVAGTRRAAFKVDKADFGELVLSSRGERLLIYGLPKEDAKARTFLAAYRARDGRRLWRKEDVILNRPGAPPAVEADDQLGVALYATWYAERGAVRVTALRADDGEIAFDAPGSLSRRAWLIAGGRLVIAASDNGFDLRVPDTWASSLPAERHVAAVTRVAVSSDGRTIASAGGDGSIFVRGPGAAPVRLPHGGSVEDLAFVSGRDELVVAHYGRAYRWDVRAQRVVAETRGTAATDFERANLRAKLLPGAARVAFASYVGPLEIRALDGDRQVERIERWCDSTGRQLAEADLSGRGLCFTWEKKDETRALRGMRDGALRRKVGKGGVPQSIALSPNGRDALLIGYEDAAVVGVGGGPVRKLADEKRYVTAAVFSSDGRRVFVAGVDGQLHVYEARTGKRLETVSFLPELDTPTALAAGSDGRTLVVGTSRGLVYRLETVAP